MISLDDAVIARLKTHNHNFEIYVDPEKALAVKGGEEADIDEILAADEIFKDAAKGERASSEVLLDIFKTEEISEIVSQIIKKGELHLTTEQRRRMLGEKRKQIINIIAKNAINPQTKSPHPPARIEKAMEEARIEISLQKSPQEQVESVLKGIRPIIPIKFDKIEVALKIPAEYAGKLYKVIHDFGEVKKEEWAGKEQYCLIEIPAGVRDDFTGQLNNITHGNVNIKVLERGASSD